MMVHIADVRLNVQTHEVVRAKQSIYLTKQEFKLLQLLIDNKNTLVSREGILKHIWHASGSMKTRIVDVYIGYLRKKIDQNFEKKLIKTVHAKGYMITA
ncbi:hypothetical protein CO051_00875 [Candidatus Roizmanbacteria bacterium CG_4_9_14_0_2_um_filter_39_13]|uniref:OmpR/PhoB-type domain-containing protein n=2 Tax=Candidatus Roizmaniibacteriota TaxID=1752723 RepID=A0A2M8F3K7_9BACT|nr:MAG: hypothetical protein COY15_05290 [Candidatus Roizmanbacteria bacterium CG_4_10_14_0_2_um_filter_39_12]PJC33841.1 MAG: hypothetical protein CO051_00875 [Candidatus Roizmanbacteria bacterium CG_4_9_14_0_2_um_filter_39_13]PJE61617.1 MAG: hypothetical protein COU87_03640 [Candidatus Roizmanbacteria bacterium CG10_big_fil_rev_8_21_14_0_10_39_12]